MRGAGFLAVTILAAGCGLSKPPAPWHSEAMERSARMLKSLDKLEADLHLNDAQAGIYAELVSSHGRAQEIACKVTDEHVEEIHRLAAAQEQKIQQKLAQRQERRRKKKAVAQLTRRNGRS
jgi:hypothetical protein